MDKKTDSQECITLKTIFTIYFKVTRYKRVRIFFFFFLIEDVKEKTNRNATLPSSNREMMLSTFNSLSAMFLILTHGGGTLPWTGTCRLERGRPFMRMRTFRDIIDHPDYWNWWNVQDSVLTSAAISFPNFFNVVTVRKKYNPNEIQWVRRSKLGWNIQLHVRYLSWNHKLIGQTESLFW